jgi:hypothetical protein
MRWRRRKAPASVPAEIRAELDQAPEWWTRAYNELVRAAFTVKPFDPAEHVGHSVVEAHTFGGVVLIRECSECPRQLVPNRAAPTKVATK